MNNLHELRAIAADFLAREALMLDERRFRDWLALLDENIDYDVPIRIAMRDYKDEFPEGAFRIKDCMAHIKTRIARLESDHAWAEVPPSRTLRVVGSMIVEATDRPDEVAVTSAMILYRQRGSEDLGDVIPVRRHDVLRIGADGSVKLLKRRALITETVLHTPNLGVFL
ncbi:MULTISPECIES: aromatic-ring-hydroxylating dioxygenase subunit beta [unclassified Pseudomonas]|uniref:aromatic-ring-hydroxylating dioxygenase subunit beta n=1 Tax=unclassified Pseudomonas TaxID=196821 RepID=UPI0002A210D0|nr:MULTISPECIES: aromatic-ring-hydroxylating dioxygenase subunit beta [unclassified Pseudomonas]MBB1606076.1 phenylpropionate dioxygenase [Pseudomonas sp. UMC76]MBB1636549.1 phenylpropionate dioxygenase [Pseudomonas sp. UME83]NTX92709.1 phenylpropionate dioxygenase [Pseudomonas sp. UMA643]NTY19931.1 phenylpropionate dioxygenase [Pseudomonas sp. UMC3103]NTY27340.1 phenylpropionate dioxygenase [Pseudomonas sp. UMA603]